MPYARPRGDIHQWLFGHLVRDAPRHYQYCRHGHHCVASSRPHTEGTAHRQHFSRQVPARVPHTGGQSHAMGSHVGVRIVRHSHSKSAFSFEASISNSNDSSAPFRGKETGNISHCSTRLLGGRTQRECSYRARSPTPPLMRADENCAGQWADMSSRNHRRTFRDSSTAHRNKVMKVNDRNVVSHVRIKE